MAHFEVKKNRIDLFFEAKPSEEIIHKLNLQQRDKDEFVKYIKEGNKSAKEIKDLEREEFENI